MWTSVANYLGKSNLDNNSQTAKRIRNALPIKGTVNTWGEEIYFYIPVSVRIENPKAVVEIGDLGYWPSGNTLGV